MHGDYAPGGPEHHRLAGLDGVWHDGTFPGTPGDSFSNMLLRSNPDEPASGWALQLAPDPTRPWDARAEDGNTAAQMYEAWERLDALFPDDVVRVETTFTFTDDGPEQPVQANTYGSSGMMPGGRYDTPHPSSGPLELWAQVAAGERYYEPSTFMGVINDLDPDRYPEVFSSLPNSAGFISRLQRLARDQQPPSPPKTWSIYFIPQQHNAVDDETLLVLAQEAVQFSAGIAAVDVTGLSFVMTESGTRIEEGDLHWAISEGCGDAREFDGDEPWMYCLREMCYSIAASYELADWLTQDWLAVDRDLEPLYAFWKAGGRWIIDESGVCHVSAVRSAS